MAKFGQHNDLRDYGLNLLGFALMEVRDRLNGLGLKSPRP